VLELEAGLAADSVAAGLDSVAGFDSAAGFDSVAGFPSAAAPPSAGLSLELDVAFGA
jgi:hypothetical protein